MNPLSLVTIFTFGEIITITVLGLVFYGGAGNLQPNSIVPGPCSSGHSWADSAG